MTSIGRIIFKFLYNKGGINSVKLMQERSLTVKTTFTKEYKIFILGLLISRIGIHYILLRYLGLPIN